MSYIRAEEVLPIEILTAVQQYVDGQTIYIPRKSEEKRTWGSATGTKKNLELRNSHMYTKYQEGTSVKDLAQEYFLSEKSVQRIIKNLKPSNKI